MSSIVDVCPVERNGNFLQKCYIPLVLWEKSSFRIGDLVVIKCSSRKFVCRVYPSTEPKSSIFVDDVVTVDETFDYADFSCELSVFPDNFMKVKASVFYSLKVKLIHDNQKYVSVGTEIMCDVIRNILRKYVFGKKSVIRCTGETLAASFHIHSIIIVDTYCEDHLFGRLSHSAVIEISNILSQEQLRQTRNLENAKLGGTNETMKLLNIYLLGKSSSSACKLLLVSGPSGCGKSSLIKKFCCDSKGFLVLIDGLRVKNLTMNKCNSFRDYLIQSTIVFPEHPSILFIDHLDELTPCNLKEKDIISLSAVVSLIKCLNQPGIVIIAAAVHKRFLHPAVSALFHKEITVGIPSVHQRKEMLQVLTELIPNSIIDCDKIAQMTPGFVALDISLLVTEAINSSKQSNGEENESREVTTEDFVKALSHVSPSVLKSSEWNIKVKPVFWKDIGGMIEIKKRLQMCIEWPLRNPEIFEKVDLPCPRGVLLFGPPGCCKTTLARGLATECSANFFAANPAQIYSPFVGESEKNITELFYQARLCPPSIIFLDELDSLVGRRKLDNKTQGIGEKVLSVLLNEMDGFGTKMEFQNNLNRHYALNYDTSSEGEEEKSQQHSSDAVIVIAATNRPDLIDDALLRPGRFDVILYVPPPNTKERHSILQTITEGVPFSNVDLNDIAIKTENFSGADLKNLYNKAAMNALRNDLATESVTQKNFLQALLNMQPSISREQIQMYEQLASKYGPTIKGM